jgi:hypothetical protein
MVSPIEEITKAERLAQTLDQARVPPNELGRVARLLETGRTLSQVKGDLDALSSESEHFVRSGQTRRYARDLSRLVLDELLKSDLDRAGALRVIGWTRKLLEWRGASGRSPNVGQHVPERRPFSTTPQLPRGARRKDFRRR